MIVNNKGVDGMIDDYGNDDIVGEIKTILSEYWNSLCEKYDVNIKFNILTIPEYVDHIHSMVKQNQLADKLAYDTLLNIINNNEFMCISSTIYKNEKTHKSTYKIYGAFVFLERFIKLIDSMCDIDEVGIIEILRYLKTILLFEIGKIVVIREKYINMEWDKFIISFNRLRENINECEKRLSKMNVLPITYANIRYDEIILDRMVLERVGLTRKDMLLYKKNNNAIITPRMIYDKTGLIPDYMIG